MLSCNSTLHASSYPSAGVYIDHNLCGKCSDGDLAANIVDEYGRDGTRRSYQLVNAQWNVIHTATNEPLGPIA